jgi:hypothetical protein
MCGFGRVGDVFDHAAAHLGTAGETLVTALAARTTFTVTADPISVRTA